MMPNSFAKMPPNFANTASKASLVINPNDLEENKALHKKYAFITSFNKAAYKEYEKAFAAKKLTVLYESCIDIKYNKQEILLCKKLIDETLSQKIDFALIFTSKNAFRAFLGGDQGYFRRDKSFCNSQTGADIVFNGADILQNSIDIFKTSADIIQTGKQNKIDIFALSPKIQNYFDGYDASCAGIVTSHENAASSRLNFITPQKATALNLAATVIDFYKNKPKPHLIFAASSMAKTNFETLTQKAGFIIKRFNIYKPQNRVLSSNILDMFKNGAIKSVLLTSGSNALSLKEQAGKYLFDIKLIAKGEQTQKDARDLGLDAILLDQSLNNLK